MQRVFHDHRVRSRLPLPARAFPLKARSSATPRAAGERSTALTSAPEGDDRMPPIRSLVAVLCLAGGISVCTDVRAQIPLKTAVDDTFAPHAFPDLVGGVQGFNVDLVREIGKRLGRP